MTTVKLIKVFKFYADHLSEMGVGAQKSDSGVDLRHVRWMCEEAEKLVSDGRLEKALQWLGYIQGRLAGCGTFTLEQLKAHSTPQADEPFDRDYEIKVRQDAIAREYHADRPPAGAKDFERDEVVVVRAEIGPGGFGNERTVYVEAPGGGEYAFGAVNWKYCLDGAGDRAVEDPPSERVREMFVTALFVAEDKDGVRFQFPNGEVAVVERRLVTRGPKIPELPK